MLTRQSIALVCGLFVAGCTASAPKQVAYPGSLPAPASDGTYDGTDKVHSPDIGYHASRNHRLALGTFDPVQCRFSPHFALGSSEPLPQDMLDLESMADCLQSEPARERSIEIIGHADVQGSSARNGQLARLRAQRVRAILITHGVDAARIKVHSVGEHAALGFLSPYSHGFDRRVDIALVDDGREPSDTNRYDVASWR